MIKKAFKGEKLLVISNIVVMTITFLVLGIFVTIVALSQTAIRNLEQQAQLTVFFKDEFPEENILQLQANLLSDNRVIGVEYTSKDKAYEIFTEINKDDPLLLDSVSPDILPASIGIRTLVIDDLPVIAGELEKLDGVEEIKFFQDVVERFRYWSNLGYTIGMILSGVFLLISFSIIIITIRLMINSKGHELEILKLVGASDKYVKNPLMAQGVILAFISSLIASAILTGILVAIQVSGFFTGSFEFAFMPGTLINMTLFNISLVMMIITSGIALGYISSYAAIKKYLKY